MTEMRFNQEQKEALFGRRELILAMASLGIAAPLSVNTARAAGQVGAFSRDFVDGLARKLAASPYVSPPHALPKALNSLDYDAYRQIRPNRNKALWNKDGSAFIAEALMRGWLARERVDIFEVVEGVAKPIPYTPALFTFPKGVKPVEDKDLGFSGFRLLHPINQANVLDEIAVFQGASYFRSLGKGNLYGISARGLAIGTGGPEEEFPVFRAFWLERPRREDSTVTVHALLDGPSVCGAYQMRIHPGEQTIFDVDATLYPRRTIETPGVGAMSSMFFIGAAGWRRYDDFRPAVHDSDGLEMWTGRGEHLWRPLSNPSSQQISAFQDDNPRGFGLMQRMQDLAGYQDLEARYEKRPGLWVEPLGSWGAGSVQLVEIPTEDETADNIAAFWRPAEVWQAGQSVKVAYRLHWGDESPAPKPSLRVISTRTGATRIGSALDGRRHYAIDYEGTASDAVIEALKPVVKASAGQVSPVRLDRFPDNTGENRRLRVSFDFAPPPVGTADLRVELRRASHVVGEIWVNRFSS